MSEHTAQAATEGVAAYLAATDFEMRRLCGVSYGDLVQLAPALDRSADLEAAARKNIPPAAFAEAYRQNFGLRTVAETGGDAPEHNRHRAALVEFAAGTRWNLNPGDGPATLKVGGEELQMDVVRRDGKLAFGVSCGDGEPHVRLDIGDAVKGAIHQLRQNREANAAANFGTIAPDAEPEASSPGMRGR